MFMTFESLAPDRPVACPQWLSSNIMQWQEHVWIWDLRPTLAYWQSIATQQHLPLLEVFRKVLNAAHDGVDTGSVAPAVAYRAVVAVHPWQALLLHEHLSQRRLSGLVDTHDRMGSHLYRDMEWTSWWSQLACYREHAQAVKLKSFKGPVFHRHCERLRLSVERLGTQQTPWAMQAVGDHAIQRRYGRFIEQIWSWAFPKTQLQLQSQMQQSSDEFPWRRWQAPQEYKVKRTLDDPALEWGALQDYLRLDFDRLCEQVLDKQFKLISLKWRLNLMPSHAHLDVPIRFRHPHALHRELHTHGTALLQAQYAFIQAVADLQRKDAVQHLTHKGPQDLFWVIGWELIVEEVLEVPAVQFDLFGATEHEGQQLLNLENRLAIPLLQFEVQQDWSIEESFAVFDSDRVPDDGEWSQDMVPSLCAMALKRPLFIYEKARELPQESSGLWRFCERTMTRWWQQDHRLPSQASGTSALSFDYYRYIDRERRALWVSRVDSKQWLVHGIFA